MVKRKFEDFDLLQICKSGQCFRMKQADGSKFSLVAFGLYLEIEQNQNEFYFSCEEEEFKEVWEDYFDLNTDYSHFKNSVDQGDGYMSKAILCGNGIRILKQEFWEVCISFIISQNNNISRIKKCVQSICENFGEQKYHPKGELYYAFPSAEKLAGLEEKDLNKCGLGYRSRYIIETARANLDGRLDKKKLENLEYDFAKQELVKLYGVGSKVADCICLFALHHIGAFPIDTHIKSMLSKYYPGGFPFERYHGFAGVLQQYAFYYELFGE